MWTEARLSAMARHSFSNNKLIVVSNRAPYVHHRDGERIVCVSPAGGLTSALTPVVSAAGGTWIAQASGSADRETACRRGRVRVPTEDPTFTLRRLWVPQDLQRRYYDGLANQALWPLCHNVYQRPSFRECDWGAYKRVNEIFAESVLDEAAGQPATVFVQDYHLALLPGMLKAINPVLTVAQFWHIPWPSVDQAMSFPWMEELLEGVLGNDVLGFHLHQHCRNFMDTVEVALNSRVNRIKGIVFFGANATEVTDAPISIDFDAHTKLARSAEVAEAMLRWRNRLAPAVRVGIGIDRMDYTKGIPERLRAIQMLLGRNPELRGRFTFVQVAVPSRGGVCEYAELERSIDREAEVVNSMWGTNDWQPIIVEKQNLSPVEMMALHRLAEVCLVTPLHDGMNLVAKEFVASRFDDDGVLVLSRFAGAARELVTAVQINPFLEARICSGVEAALSMPRPERRLRMSEARRVVEKNNVYRWAGALIEKINASKRSDVAPARVSRFERLSASVA
jgi:trehalose-6-phosphate synthase